MIWRAPLSSRPHVRCFLSASLLTLLLFSFGCRKAPSEKPIGAPVSLKPPLGLPPVPIPPGNPPTKESIALGRRLFYDPRLSKDNTVACSSCHQPAADFSDIRSVSLGVGGAAGVRNAPALINSAYLPLQFWDGRAPDLEQQATIPMEDPAEMNQPHDVSVSKIAKDPDYRRMFREAFGTEDVTLGRIENALASFERTILSGNSAFDRYQYGGDKTALTPQQVRGLAVFIDPNKGNCAVCHTITPQYALFTDGKFHNLGEGVDDEGSFKDVGRFQHTKNDSDKGSFKTPTLRNIEKTAPYMHDGSLQTLRQVVDFYAGEGNSNPYLDKEMKKIHLSGQDRADLVEFLKSLTGDLPPNVGPPGKE